MAGARAGRPRLRVPGKPGAAGGVPFSGCRVSNNADQLIGNATPTTLTWNVERWDVGGLAALPDTKITIPTTGRWTLGCCVEWENTGGLHGERRVELCVNGVIVASAAYDYAAGDKTLRQGCETLWSCAAGDVVTVVVYQDSTANFNIKGLASYSPELWAGRIG
jgi:hypothetical protein